MSERTTELDAEDSKIVALARAARARNGAAEGAAVRDLDGRTYTAATVELTALALTALQVAVAMAASSGAEGLEAAAVVTAAEPAEVDIAAARDLGGAELPVHIAGPDGILVASLGR